MICLNNYKNKQLGKNTNSILIRKGVSEIWYPLLNIYNVKNYKSKIYKIYKKKCEWKVCNFIKLKPVLFTNKKKTVLVIL